MKRIVDLISKESLNINERLEILDELYWLDWGKLRDSFPDIFNKIFVFLRNDTFNEEEISLIQKLYNNPEGAYIEEFSSIIIRLYKEDKIKFFKALHLNPEEGDALAYLFRNNRIFNADTELYEILNTGDLTEDEILTTKAFFRTYENLCNT